MTQLLQLNEGSERPEVYVTATQGTYLQLGSGWGIMVRVV